MTDALPEIRVADADSSLPTELKQFFERGGSSLLIKGTAGTGKTTLALTLLRALSLGNNFLYASTRESPVQFLRDHAWIAERFGAHDAVHAKKEPGTEPDSDVLGGFVDARLDEPTQLLERITSQLMDARSPFIVIDTWDAMQDFAGNKALKTNARVLQTWAERAGARLVFTMEDADNMALDALVEGVLILKQRNHSSRRLREMIISKLYGVSIQNPFYFFTLNNAGFRSFRHYRTEDLTISADVATAKSSGRPIAANGGYFPMGYPELDQALGGGLPVGCAQSIEIESQVNMKIPFFLIGRIMASFALSGNQVRLFPIAGLDRDTVAEFLRVSVPRSYLKNVSQPDSADESAKEEVTAGTAVLSVLDPNGLGEEKLRNFANVARSTGGATIFIGRESKRKDNLERIFANTGSRMKITYMDGTLFLQSKIPLSQFFGLTVSRRSGIPEIDLEPMV